MKTQTNQQQYNKAVTQAYFKLLKAAKELLSAIEEEPLRYSMTREDKCTGKHRFTLHQFISPLLYLRLDLHNGETYIHYGYEVLPVFSPYYQTIASFTRTVYKLTMDNGSPINIENAVRVDWVLTNVSEAYEYLEEQGAKYHRFEMIAYKPKLSKRKLQRVA